MGGNQSSSHAFGKSLSWTRRGSGFGGRAVMGVADWLMVSYPARPASFPRIRDTAAASSDGFMGLFSSLMVLEKLP